MIKNKFIRMLCRAEQGKDNGVVGNKRTDYNTMSDYFYKTGKKVKFLGKKNVVGIIHPVLADMYKNGERRSKVLKFKKTKAKKK